MVKKELSIEEIKRQALLELPDRNLMSLLQVPPPTANGKGKREIPAMRPFQLYPRRLGVFSLLVSLLILVAITTATTPSATAAATHSAASARDTAVAPTVVQQPQNAPFLFNYIFNGHLKLGGGNFTVGGTVYLVVKFNNGTVVFSKKVVAQTHPVTPGGAIYVETPIAAPCAPGNNGYAQAYDYTTSRWTPRLPVAICGRLD